MIDGHDGERYNPEETSLEMLLEIRRATVETVIAGAVEGRRYWRDQLDEIDDEIAYRDEHEGVPDYAVESQSNRLWRDYVMVLSDALRAERWRQVQTYRATWPRRDWWEVLGPWTGVPQTVGDLIPA